MKASTVDEIHKMERVLSRHERNGFQFEESCPEVADMLQKFATSEVTL